MSLYSIASRVNTVEIGVKSKVSKNNPTFTGTVTGITKGIVGLGNVDNTSDANKPVSTLTHTALDAKAPLANPTFTAAVSFTGTSSVTGITKTTVGLEIVDNTVDASKPISTDMQLALNAKANQSTTYTKDDNNNGLNLKIGGNGTVHYLPKFTDTKSSGKFKYSRPRHCPNRYRWVP